GAGAAGLAADTVPVAGEIFTLLHRVETRPGVAGRDALGGITDCDRKALWRGRANGVTGGLGDFLAGAGHHSVVDPAGGIFCRLTTRPVSGEENKNAGRKFPPGAFCTCD